MRHLNQVLPLSFLLCLFAIGASAATRSAPQPSVTYNFHPAVNVVVGTDHAVEGWKVTLTSGDSYTDVALESVRNDRLVISRLGDTTSIDVDAIAEIRRTRAWNIWKSMGYGAAIGGAAGYVAGAVGHGSKSPSTYLAAGLAGGALIGLLVREAFGPGDDVYDLSGKSRIEKLQAIDELLGH